MQKMSYDRKEWEYSAFISRRNSCINSLRIQRENDNVAFFIIINALRILCISWFDGYIIRYLPLFGFY